MTKVKKIFYRLYKIFKMHFHFYRFVGRKNQKDYVRIFKGDKGACWAYLGKVGGEQPISLGEGCPGTGVVTHEIMHTLGKHKLPYLGSIGKINHIYNSI